MSDLISILKDKKDLAFTINGKLRGIDFSKMTINLLEQNNTSWLQIKDREENTTEIYNLSLITSFSFNN